MQRVLMLPVSPCRADLILHIVFEADLKTIIVYAQIRSRMALSIDRLSDLKVYLRRLPLPLSLQLFFLSGCPPESSNDKLRFVPL